MIIGISGHIGSGKSTLADLLYQYYRYEPKIFAGKLKEVAALITGLPIGAMYMRDLKDSYLQEWGMTIGTLQQRLGTDAVRNGLHPDAWVIALFAGYLDQDWSISDVRFKNEARAIKDHGGILVRIEGSRTGPGGRDPNHISEIDLDDWQDWDYVFTNDGDLEELSGHARNIHEIAVQRRYGSPDML